MEIRIFSSLELALRNEKWRYCARVKTPDAFDFHKALDVFRSIYGSDVVITFICV